MKIIQLDSVDSTNTYISVHCADMPDGTAVVARAQNAGRGQRGNTWEAAPGLNVTLSVLLRPERLPVASAFLLSEAVSVAIAGALDAFLSPGAVQLKWPNDLYVGDCKLGGILIENSLAGTDVARTIVGVGINVNQTRFLSDAPNPVSIAQITRRPAEVSAVVSAIAAAIAGAPLMLSDPHALQAAYADRLWRRDTLTPYIDCASGEHFTARIGGVAPSGHITLSLPSGEMRRYAFKEVAADVGGLRKNV
ncbi:MAG: biotin--[acetyl-CoA-carboxylase] ligase [Paramuribaculum sp.]|nr:biotin--[acetyl-CoA-carboxylase] ligase [Paramuribaculum sp.]